MSPPTTIGELLKLNDSTDTSLRLIDVSHLENDQAWNKQRLQDHVNYLASLLLQQKKDSENFVIAFAFSNSIEFVILFLAICQVTAIALPLNPIYTEKEFEFFLNDGGAHVVIVLDWSFSVSKNIITAAKNISEKKIQIFNLFYDVSSKQYNMKNEENEIIRPLSKSATCVANPESVCLILHTSGTTSRPKAVPLTQNNLCVSIQNIQRHYQMVNDDISVLLMPLFHIHGLVCGLLSALVSQSTVIIPNRGTFSQSSFWQTVKLYQITWFTAVPTILKTLVLTFPKEQTSKSLFSKLRFIRSSSASLPVKLLQEIEKTFGTKVLEAYSMSEASHQMTANPLQGSRKLGTVGLPSGVEVVLLDNNGKKVETGKIGEVCIRGDNVTKGYLNNPKANEEAFRFQWFHTGDLGVFDCDGFLTLAGRIKELINRGGEKINPIEVDQVICSHPAVEEAVTFGFPDEKYGEIVCCAVKLCKPVTEEDLKSHIKVCLAGFKVPEKIFFTEEFPRTATGKVQRKHVAAYFSS